MDFRVQASGLRCFAFGGRGLQVRFRLRASGGFRLRVWFGVWFRAEQRPPESGTSKKKAKTMAFAVLSSPRDRCCWCRLFALTANSARNAFVYRVLCASTGDRYGIYIIFACFHTTFFLRRSCSGARDHSNPTPTIPRHSHFTPSTYLPNRDPRLGPPPSPKKKKLTKSIDR